ncbi:secretory lipase family protein [Halteromyces radiatus]|uniref:secretory lipase family protein n=1 Tax=Halteromyces radiatus TaxID=101107 RepID=UPI00221FD32F|nr:secretory lipase family protein [Halteromyces radiatus]KAI8086685.1 secretory lipase family protein [Halteromyces radiatus]
MHHLSPKMKRSMAHSVMILMTLLCLYVSMVSTAPLWLRDAVSPANDPFYIPSAGFENQKPGTILKSRTLSGNSLALLSGLPQNLKAVYQFLYRTTDGLGNATATVTTLMVPNNADPTKLVSYQVAEDAPFIDCAPSYALQKGTSLTGVLPQVEILLMDALLGRGYYVNTADYEGPKSMFTVGAMAGHGVLDSIRAVLASGNQTQLHSDATVQMWGYSGGALATGWAAQLQPSYASELKIVGAAMGGTPVNVNATLNAINGGPFAGLIPAGILGLSHQYDDLAAYINQILLPDKKQEFLDAQNSCLAPLILKYAFKNINSFVSRPDFMADPIATKVITDNIMGKVGAPKIPLFMYHAIHDEVVPMQPAFDMYNSWCSSNSATSIQFVKDELSEHAILAITGAANAMNFLIDGFNNKTAPSGCSTRTTVTSALDPGAIPVFGQLIWDDLKAILGQPIGPNNTF